MLVCPGREINVIGRAPDMPTGKLQRDAAVWTYCNVASTRRRALKLAATQGDRSSGVKRAEILILQVRNVKCILTDTWGKYAAF